MPELALTMPKMSMTMTEGTVVAWLKQPGEAVREGEAVLEVATDKVDMEVESPYEGVLARIAAEEGEIVPVGEPLGWIDSAADDLLGGLLPGEAAGDSSPDGPEAEAGGAGAGPDVASELAPPEPETTGARFGSGAVSGSVPSDAEPAGARFGSGVVSGSVPSAAEAAGTRGQGGQEHAPATGPGRAGIIPAVPAARRVAAELGIELAEVTPGGPWGSIRLADVLAVAEPAAAGPGTREDAAFAGPGGASAGSGPRLDAASAGPGEQPDGAPAGPDTRVNGAPAGEDPRAGAMPAVGPLAMTGASAAGPAVHPAATASAGSGPAAPATGIPEIDAAISALQGLALRLGAQLAPQRDSAPRRDSGARSVPADALPGSLFPAPGGTPGVLGVPVSDEHVPADRAPRTAAAADDIAGASPGHPVEPTGLSGLAEPAGMTGAAQPDRPAGSAGTAETAGPAGSGPRGGTREERRRQRIRALLAQAMSASAAVPQFTVYADIDLEALEHARREQLGGASWTAILLRAQGIALAQSPALTASWDERTGRAAPDAGIGIALAVDTPLGLLAPVVRDPHRRPLAEVADEVRALARAAQDGALAADALAGATTVFSNLGGFGVDRFNALITPPHATALSAGSVARRMRVFDDGSFAPRLQVTLGLTVDHRVADGADAARCMSALRTILADPGALA